MRNKIVRRKGSTNWFLDIILNKPECEVVCGNSKTVKYLEATYEKMLLNQPWWKKLVWNFSGRVKPVFKTLSEVKSVGEGRPLLFDNSCINL